jgi:acyl carrier protein
LRGHLDAKLPDYMVPAFLIELQEIPYTPSGKVDLKALPKPSIQNSRYADEEVRYESETERELAAIWGELLGMDGIPRTADFFELGGDSLRAVTLFLKIQQLFGQDFPLATLSHTSSIAGLAGLIDGGGDIAGLSGFRSLQMLQAGEPGETPLFLVHGGQGNVLVFSKLVKMQDPRQPVFAFQWPGWDGYPGSSDVEELARDYCEELVRFRPSGDFRLGGYCIGGLIAIAMARRLEEMGRKILDPLVVWDAPNLKSGRYRREEPWDSAGTIADFNRMKERLKAVRIPTTLEDESGVPKSDFAPPSGKGALIRKVPGLMSLLRLGKAMEKRRREAPRRRETAGYLKRGEALPMELRAEYCLDCMVHAARHHRSAGYAGNMLYFRSDCVVSQYFGLNGWWDDIYLGFKELCMGEFEAHAVGGGHTDVVEIPEMAEIVRQKFQPPDGS